MIWQQQTAADAHRQLLLADAIACGSSLSCYLAAVDAASDYHTTDMKKAPGSARGFLMIPDYYVLCTPAIPLASELASDF